MMEKSNRNRENEVKFCSFADVTFVFQKMGDKASKTAEYERSRSAIDENEKELHAFFEKVRSNLEGYIDNGYTLKCIDFKNSETKFPRRC